MRTLQSWLAEYSESHQDHRNQILHKICVPIIFFSILGMLWIVPVGPVNLALVVVAVLVPFYIRLGLKALAIVLPQVIVSFAVLIVWQRYSIPAVMFILCLWMFIMAWIGQFVGHKYEGKKPSFFKDLQFLLIGPLWVFKSKK